MATNKYHYIREIGAFEFYANVVCSCGWATHKDIVGPYFHVVMEMTEVWREHVVGSIA